MSSRERNLLILLVTMAFLAVNFLGYKMWYAPKLALMRADKQAAEDIAESNEVTGSHLDTFETEIRWLSDHEPKPSSLGQMKARIQQLAENEAKRAQLKIKDEDFGDDVIDPGLNYHRARYDIEVNGSEASIHRWLDRLHKPSEFRVVTFIRLKPQRDDPTRADCKIFLDQWFVPETS